MEPDDQLSRASTAGGLGDTVRRQVLEAAADILHGTGDPGSAGSPSGGPAMIVDPSDHGAMTVYLALLQDRLPIYARTMKGLAARAGQDDVADNLATAGQATIDFYAEILAAKVSVFANPAQLLQLRRVLKARGLGPHIAPEAVAAYLERERELGRIAADADCDAAARLLIGSCVNYAFTKMLLEDVPAPDTYVAAMVRGLRLGP